MLAAPAVLAGAALVFLGGSVGRSGTSWDLGFKPLWFFVAANGYSTPLSAAILGLVALVALRLRRCDGLVLEQAGGWLAAGLRCFISPCRKCCSTRLMSMCACSSPPR